MQKTKTKLITALLLTAMTLAIFPLAVNASTGFILIGATIAPSAVTSVPAGGNVNLNFGSVLFSGGQFYLLLSKDGFSQVSAGDIRFTPSFSLASLQAPSSGTPVTDPTATFPGSWNIGDNWVNGTIPSNIAGGPYFVKAFDGATTSVAVTDIPFTVNASLAVVPTSGAAGTSITLSGNAFPANARVNITYINPFTLPNPTLVTVSNLTQAGAIGNLTLTIPAPDLMQAAAIGDNPAVSNSITFRAQENLTGTIYTAVYNENERGLLQFGRPRAGSITGSLQNATGIYGNLTSFVSSVSVGVGDSLRVVGNWFYPGNVTLKWDNAVNITATNLAANGTGFFNTTITVPTTGNGAHNLTIVDSNSVVFAVFLNVVQSITISPTSGGSGTTVTVNGFGFPAAGVPASTAYNATITFDTTARGWALTDANGAFTTTIVVPTASGGAHTITATTNDSSLTSASKPFTVVSAFTLNPTSFFANNVSTVVTATGTGFDPTMTFFVAIDNVFSPFTNTTNGIAPNSAGNLTFGFIGVGFQPGLHVVTIYQAGSGAGSNAPFAKATFTVLSTDNLTLTNINATLDGIHTDVNTAITAANAATTAANAATAAVSGLSGSITSISSGIATIQSSQGTLQASLTSLGAQITSVQGDTATLSTSLGTITTSLSTLNAAVTKIDGNVATIQTDLGTLTGTVTQVKDGQATIQTDLGTLKADVSTVKTDAENTKNSTASLSPLIIVAIVLALIAAIAAIASIVLMRRKIAG